jgi:hypothetical protein
MAEHNQEALPRLRARYQGGDPDRARIVDDLTEAHDRLMQEAGGHPDEDQPARSPRDDKLWRELVEVGRLTVLREEISVLGDFIETELDERKAGLLSRPMEPTTVVWDDSLRGSSAVTVRKTGRDSVTLTVTISKAL